MWFDILKQHRSKLKAYYSSIEEEFDRWMMQNQEQAFTIDDIMDFIDLRKIAVESIEHHNKYKFDKISFQPRTLNRLSNPNNKFASKVIHYLPRLLNKNGYEKLTQGEQTWIKSSMRQSILGEFYD
mgnify:CR=1 FL=1|tara:strand:- start:2979 stop:3356 length:378 start_codon:yes stop_codon:yes gene_type:complete